MGRVTGSAGTYQPGRVRSGNADLDPRATRRDWRTGWILVLTATLVLGWLVLVFFVDSVRFVVFNPRAKTGFEVFLAVGQLFGALVLALAPVGDAVGRRMRWVAGGFGTLGLGTLGFGYLYPLLTDAPNLSTTMYGSIYVRAIGISLIAVGLVPGVAPRVPRTGAFALAALIGLMGITVALVADGLPALVRVAGMTTIIDHNPARDNSGSRLTHAHLADLEQVVSTARTVFPGLTAWHWGVSLIPLTAALLTGWGTFRQHRRCPLSTWLLVAVVLLAGAQVHSLFWPSMYSSILTTTSVLRLGVAAIVIAGGILELRRLIDERAALLAAERERTDRMAELAALKADFTAIVAHELASPLAAITTMGEMLATGALPAGQSAEMGTHIVAETRLLRMLVADVRASADVERDDFHVLPRPISVASLLAEAAAYARTLPQTHAITIAPAPDTVVDVDPDRLGQVLRNLLTNAVRHTPAGTPITVRVIPVDGRVTFEVADRGPGIAPEDQARIFEKFGRGRDATHRATPGRGLGLYLSRRILQAHGSDLHVTSAPGQGTTFHFTLEKAR